jgi:uncharacterized RDD family membrane protein YckC
MTSGPRAATVLPVTEPPYPPPPPGPNPYGPDPTPPAYGQPSGQPYSQNPYGGPGYAAPPPIYPYASWGRRVAAYLVDVLLSGVASIPLAIGYGWLIASVETTTYDDYTTTSEYTGGAGPIVLMVIGLAPAIGFWVWNICIRQGRTGYSLGKSNLGIRLVKESTGQPMGAGLSFVRQLAHYVDGLVCYLGYLWPLWDAKRQTFADKIMSVVVIKDR